MTKQQLLDKLQSSEELIRIAYVPVSEVINWVNELEESKPSFTDEQVTEFARQIVDSITDMGIDAIDDYDLTMSYREVELDSVEFNTYQIQKNVESELQELFSVDEA